MKLKIGNIEVDGSPDEIRELLPTLKGETRIVKDVVSKDVVKKQLPVKRKYTHHKYKMVNKNINWNDKYKEIAKFYLEHSEIASISSATMLALGYGTGIIQKGARKAFEEITGKKIELYKNVRDKVYVKR